uniref:COesterase domain-containing protein n=1 Tax=Rhabditophanes sp. KR3021 TaxID=114890 RepID=A0AC35TTX2_9BILA
MICRNGFIEGRKSDLSHNNRTGLIFQGIPYGKGISGTKRFNLGQEVADWDNILDVKHFSPGCIYNSSSDHGPKKSNFNDLTEDCLKTNIYTSKYCLINRNCSVLFYIHSGNNLAYGPSMFNEETIVDNFANDESRIVVVTANYRLGLMGFINLNSKLNLTAPQNLGLFDLVLALKWVQKEIHIFGGDPIKVTIGGDGSGAELAHLISLSPKARGLFSKILKMSGTVDNLYKNGDEMSDRLIAIEAKCANNATNWDLVVEVENVLSCLRTKTPQIIVNSLRAVESKYNISKKGYSQDYGVNSFFEKDIETLASECTIVPLMIGTTEKESMASRTIVQRDQNNTVYIDEDNLKFYCEFSLVDMIFVNQSNAVDICIKDHSKNVNRSLSIIDDTKYFIPIITEAKYATSKGSPVYLYNFEYNQMKKDFTTDSFLSQENMPIKGSDSIYFMGNFRGDVTQKYYQIRKAYIDVFVSFINNGNASTKNNTFDVYNPKLNNYFAIDFDENATMPGMKNGYHSDSLKYYNNLLLKGGSFNLNRNETSFVRYSQLDKALHTFNDTYTIPGFVEPIPLEKRTKIALSTIAILVVLFLAVILSLWCCLTRSQKAGYKTLN